MDMKKTISKIYTILVLIKNLIFRKKHYKLHFVAENYKNIFKRWYYDFKHWGFKHGQLEMVSGANQLCELYANGKNEVTVEIVCAKKQLKKYKETHDEFIGEVLPENTPFLDKYLYGRNYTCNNFSNTNEKKRMWICPVTLFVLGRYPNFIYIKKI